MRNEEYYSNQKYEITGSTEYQNYLKALCRLSSEYVSRIREQFADKAYEMYQDETVRKIVYAYGEEAKKLDESRVSNFLYACRYGVSVSEYLDDDCLSKAGSYADTIKMLFEIK